MPRRRLLVVFGLFLALMAYLTYQALWSPHIEFLRPSWRAEWIVHPNPPFTFQQQPACADADFVHTFRLSAMPKRFEIRVTAMRTFELTINGQTLPAPSGAWKRGTRVDLAPFLRKDAENILKIRVGGIEGPPALLVEGPAEVRSDRRWKVALGPGFDASTQVVIALRGEAYLAGKLNPLRTSAKFPFYLAAFGLYGVLILYALIPLRLKSWIQPSAPSHPDSFWRRHGFCLMLLIAVAAVQIHNVLRFAHTRSGFDWAGHVDYIRYIAEHWRFPIATQGWEMFQPPLYYLSSALIYKLFGGLNAEPASLKAIQVYTTLVGLGNIALAWGMLCILFPTQPRMRNLGFSVAAMLPMGFYMNSMISNEIFSGGVIGLAIFLAVRLGFRRELRWRDAFGIGLGCGLALLSKYTGLFLFLSVLILLGFRLIGRWRGNPRRWAWSALLLAITLTLCGWLYIRNVRHFGDPFIGNWDTASGFHYEQPPGYRTLGFYTRFGSLFVHQPEWSRWANFWEGKYASMWMDTHGTFLNLGDRTTQILGSVILWLALLPSVAILLGFGRAVWQLLRRDWDQPLLILVLTSTFTVVSVISFTMEVPTFSTVKAFFFLSLIASLGVFAALGLETMCRQLGRLRWLVYGNLGILYGIIFYLFWYRGT